MNNEPDVYKQIWKNMKKQTKDKYYFDILSFLDSKLAYIF